MISKIHAKNRLEQNNTNSLFVLSYDTIAGISDTGKRMSKAELLKCIDESNEIQLHESAINIMEIYNDSNIVYQVFIE